MAGKSEFSRAIDLYLSLTNVRNVSLVNVTDGLEGHVHSLSYSLNNDVSGCF